MVSLFATSAVGRGFEPRWGQTKDNLYLLLLATHTALGERAKTGWLGIGIIGPSGWRHVHPWTIVTVSRTMKKKFLF